jgi:hypothetical protein
MVLPLYLAQTSLEMAGNSLPEHPAYMACHFSSGSPGLSNLPVSLPAGTMLILDDSTPMADHDPELIGKQLANAILRHNCKSLLLDFQRKDISGQQELAKLLADSLPCPVGVSEIYAERLSCPVFLPPVPPDKPLRDYLAPWQGREIWLEAALEGITLTLTEAGCSIEALYDFPEDGLRDDQLSCHYTVETTADSAIFRLWRTRQDLDALLATAETQGVAKAIGLWQELGK